MSNLDRLLYYALGCAIVALVVASSWPIGAGILVVLAVACACEHLYLTLRGDK